MPVLQLTKRNIDKLVFTQSGQVSYFDTELKGFFLRVGQSTKTFYVKVDVRDHATGKFKSVKGKVGRYGEITPEQARSKAPDIMQRLRAGLPVDEVKQPTLRELYHQYVNDKNLKSNTATAYKIYFENAGGAKFPAWMDIPVKVLMEMLTPDVVVRRYQEVLSNSGKGAASNAFKMLQAIFNYGMVLYPQYITINPVRVITAAELWPEIKARTTCIEPDQFKHFHDALLTFPVIHRDCYLFALYQGLRPDEAHSLRWEDVSLDKQLFDLTWKDSETKHRGVLPLSRQSMEILNRRKDASQEEDIFVFPSESGRSKSGHVILRADKLRATTGLDVTPHSLRRSFVTVGERLRLRREDINLLTNHVDQSITGKHYSRIGVEDIRAPLQVICNEIERLMKDG
jgi:integrase